jgi:hypothetical protein
MMSSKRVAKKTAQTQTHAGARGGTFKLVLDPVTKQYKKVYIRKRKQENEQPSEISIPDNGDEQDNDQ